MELPLLSEIVAAGGVARPHDLYSAMQKHFPGITEHDLRLKWPGTGDNRWQNTVRRVRHNLVLKGELHRGPTGIWRITSKGRARVEDAERDPYIQLGILEGAQGISVSDAFADLFQAANIEDARRRTLRAIVLRSGQHTFREKLLDAYHCHCAVTDCDAVEALEAAHIVGYLGPETNHLSNGLLLRSDIHTLFDLGLVSIDSETMTVLISPHLKATVYASFAGRELHLPEAVNCRPSKQALDQHRGQTGL
jgi:hypothetical protein